ncbi:hypothetical protein N7460_004787 [Penicillium canescens]|uniref:3'-5' exonuclease domain-containing protein n=2 Tax=Penicillium canescens TaxID=5083 RepID=A0AAD6ICQ0_PENCN|nr:hypothetical protein N7460_004787 [Penicillium canescens]
MLEKAFNNLPSVDQYIDVFLMLKYFDFEVMIQYIDRECERYQAMFKTLLSWENKRILAITSSVEDSVLRAEETTQKLVAEWEGLSFSILNRLATEVLQITDRVVQAESVTQEYVAAVTDLSYKVRLSQVDIAVTEAEKAVRLMDHDFCLVVFFGTPELTQKVEELDRNLVHWQRELLNIATSLLTHQVNISRLSIHDMEDTIQDGFLKPRQSARRRIDEITIAFDKIHQDYKQLQAKANAVLDGRVHILCTELSYDPDLSHRQRSKLGQLGRAMSLTRNSLMAALHSHRSAWRKRVMQSHSLRKAQLWELSDLSKVYRMHNNNNSNGRERLFEAFALGPRHGGKLAQHLAENSRDMASALRSIYLPRYRRLPARSPRQNFYWQQLDVVWPMYHLDTLCWLLSSEVWYLQHTLKGSCGPLWEGIPAIDRRFSATKMAEWNFKFQVHRNELRQELGEFYNINWMRLQSESKLYAMGERAYLSGRFEVPNPMSQDRERFKEWAMHFARICSEAWINSFALYQSPEFWNRLYQKLEANRKADNDLGQGHLLAEFGSEPVRKKAVATPPLPRTGSFKTTKRSKFVRSRKSNAPRKTQGKGAAAPPNAQPEAVSKQSEALPLADQKFQTKIQGTGRPWWMRSRETGKTRTTNPEVVTPEPKNAPISSNQNKASQPWTMAQKIQEIFGFSNDLNVHQPSLTKTPSQPTEDASLDMAESEPSAKSKRFQNMFTGRSYSSPSVELKDDPPGPKDDLPDKTSPHQPYPQNLPGTTALTKAGIRRRRRREQRRNATDYYSLPQSDGVSESSLPKQSLEHDISPITPTKIESPPSGEPSDDLPGKWPPHQPYSQSLPGMGTSKYAIKRRLGKQSRSKTTDPISYHSLPQSSGVSEGSLPKQSLEHDISPIIPTKIDSRPSGEPSDIFPGQTPANGLQLQSRPGKAISKQARRRRLLRSVFGRSYTTDASSYQTSFRHCSGVSNGSLPEQSLEHAISPIPLTKGHGSESLDKASLDETVPASDIDLNVSVSAAPKFWSHSSQQSPGGEKLIVHYCRTLHNTEEIAQHFLDSKVLGFDMEWKSSASAWDSIQNNVSVIQIANEERIAIFQIASFKPSRSLKDLVSPTLKRIIESPDITKVGVSIKADCTRLRKYLAIDAKATFELSHLFKLVKYGQENPKLVNKRGVNLSEQMEEHFGLPLEKNEDVRCGDWARALSYRQVQYAATDPYACIRLFNAMEAKRLAMDPVPPRPAFAELNRPIILPLGQAVNSEDKEPPL